MPEHTSRVAETGSPTPYYEDASVSLYLGKAEDVLPWLPRADCAVVDPPYAETSLSWDRWIPELPSLLADRTDSMWCFGSMRMFLTNIADFADWKFSQDVVWEKHNGSGFHADRFKRVHEAVTHWYRGDWSGIRHETPTTQDAVKRATRRRDRPSHTGGINTGAYVSEDGGPRLMRSVIYCRSMHGSALHPTEKPAGILEPLIEYACKPGGLVLDPTAGSGAVLAAAKATGRYAIGIERDEKYCEVAARRLAQDVLFGGVA